MNDITAYEGVMQTVQKESSLIEAFTKPEIINKVYLFAPPEIQKWEDDKKEQFIRKTMMTIAHDEKLKPCFESEQGKMSLMTAVTKCCSTGLEIGGKHAYLIPQKNGQHTEARFSIRAGGYFALLCGGERPIFKDLRWSLVYTEDECEIDGGKGEVIHKYKIAGDRGDLLGCWVQIVKKNGQKEAKFYPMKKVNQWRAKSKMQNGAWKEWNDEMTEQACIRHTCDKYEQARDLLVASIYDNENEDYQTEDKSGFDEINDMIDDEKELKDEADF
jgi:recombinational DNA repair protein RecT